MDEKGIPGMAATRNPGDKLIFNAIKNTTDCKKWKCPCCGVDLPFQSLEWLEEFRSLINKHSGLGISPDIASLTLIECWGLYQWLSKL